MAVRTEPVDLASVDGPGDSAPSASLVVIDRPERRNALDTEHCTLIANAVAERVAAGDRSLAITGAGTSFCSGADFGDVTSGGFRAALHTMLDTITDAPIPIVAVVNGHAIGAGLQLAIAADLRVAAPTASFGIPTARLGLAVDPWTIERLVALAGGGAARRLLLTCSILDADDSRVAGLIDQIGDLEAALALTAELATLAPLTLRYIKQTVDAVAKGARVSDDASILAAFEACWSSDDLAEGLSARDEKRPARFEGR
ncbi:MAG: enoyl-CoA hydratase [Acidimicrobiales bacterium]